MARVTSSSRSRGRRGSRGGGRGSNRGARAAAVTPAPELNPEFAAMPAADLITRLLHSTLRESDFADAALVFADRERRLAEAEERVGALQAALDRGARQAKARLRRVAEAEERLRDEIGALLPQKPKKARKKRTLPVPARQPIIRAPAAARRRPRKQATPVPYRSLRMNAGPPPSFSSSDDELPGMETDDEPPDTETDDEEEWEEDDDEQGEEEGEHQNSDSEDDDPRGEKRSRNDKTWYDDAWFVV